MTRCRIAGIMNDRCRIAGNCNVSIISLQVHDTIHGLTDLDIPSHRSLHQRIFSKYLHIANVQLALRMGNSKQGLLQRDIRGFMQSLNRALVS